MAKAAKSTKTANSREPQNGSSASQASKKPMRPLSSLFGPASSTSNHTESIKQPAKVKTNRSERAAKRVKTLSASAVPASTSAAAIELSSDEELLLDDDDDEVKIEEDRGIVIKPDDDETEDSADDLIVTGYQAGPSQISNNKPDVRGNTAKTNGSAKPAVKDTASSSSKAKGKLRAVDNFVPELEIADTKASE